jgi:hypothetical protein
MTERHATISIAKAIRVLIQKGDHAADKAEQFYKAAALVFSLKKARLLPVRFRAPFRFRN